ncbi:MAG: tetratricopeptide repeat protein [Calditrichaeota bacterium]|nr:tetratricopeptide repeat protein [Calditrichota bacterium]
MPDYLDIYYVLGCMRMRVNRHRAAISEFKKALTLLEKLRQKPALTQLKLDVFNSEHLIHKYMAGCYLSLGNKMEAQNSLENAIKIRPEYSEAHYLLGALFLEENDLQPAAREFARVLETSPEHIGALVNMAVVAVRQDRFDVAKQYLLKIANRDDIDPDIYHVLGELCTRIKEFHLGINFYEKYLQKRPQRFDVLNNIASCCAQLGNYQAAILGYQSVLEMEPGNELARKNLVELGRYLQKQPCLV